MNECSRKSANPFLLLLPKFSMLCIKSISTSPSFNLALEEYLFNKTKEDVFLIYQNEPSVIIGKHQIANAECNIPYIFDRNIYIYRRISGGGTVYHDLGNLNYGFISRKKESAQVNFKYYNSIIISFLNSFGLSAEWNHRNSIEISGLKISGVAEHLNQNSVLHHGTLLFNANLLNLDRAVSSNIEKYFHHGVLSKRSKVGNICDFLENEIAIEAFSEMLMNFVLSASSANSLYFLSSAQIIEIEKIAEERYKSWEWNFGYSPAYEFLNDWELDVEKQHVKIKVKEGIIENIKLDISFLTFEWIQIIENGLIGKPHDWKVFMEFFKQIQLDYSMAKEILEHLF